MYSLGYFLAVSVTQTPAHRRERNQKQNTALSQCKPKEEHAPEEFCNNLMLVLCCKSRQMSGINMIEEIMFAHCVNCAIYS